MRRFRILNFMVATIAAFVVTGSGACGVAESVTEAVLGADWEAVYSELHGEESDNNDIRDFLLEIACLATDRSCAPHVLEDLGTLAIRIEACYQWTDSLRREHPQNAEVQYLTAALFAREGRLDDAIDAYDETLLLQEGHVLALHDRGFTRLVKGDPVAAIVDLSAALEARPGYSKAWVNRGAAYDAVGEYDKAIADYGEALQLMPDDPVIYYNRGNTYRNQALHDLALEDYSQALALDPTMTAAFHNRANTYLDLGEYAKALSDLKMMEQTASPEMAALVESKRGLIVALESGDGDFSKDEAAQLLQGGLRLFDQGRFDQAMSMFDRALAKNPGESDAHYYRAMIFSERGENDKSIDAFSSCLQLNPRDTTAYYNRAVGYQSRGEYDRAIDDLTNALVLDPKYAKALYLRASILEVTGNRGRARADYEMFLRVSTPDLAEQVDLAKSALRAGEDGPSETELESAKLAAETAFGAFQEKNWEEMAKHIRTKDLETFKQDMLPALLSLAQPGTPYIMILGKIYDAESLPTADVEIFFADQLGNMVTITGKDLEDLLTVQLVKTLVPVPRGKDRALVGIELRIGPRHMLTTFTIEMQLEDGSWKIPMPYVLQNLAANFGRKAGQRGGR